jgi:hypothetical protein
MRAAYTQKLSRPLPGLLHARDRLLVECTRGVALGDRNYWSPEIKDGLDRSIGIELLAPCRTRKRDRAPERSAL